MVDLEEKKFDTCVELADGAMYGLSDGAKMDIRSSIIEYVDNAEDENASFVSIEIDDITHTISVMSIENTDLELEDCGKLFNLGVGGKLHTKKNGVGKYSQGFKYAGPCLIGEGNKGEIRVEVRPISGNDWGAIQYVDYVNDGHYSDKHIKYADQIEMPYEYNFMVKVSGCKAISPVEITKLKIDLGIRYRERIEKGLTIIVINGEEILPQDRLYSRFGSRVDYNKSEYFEWKEDKMSMCFESSDLRLMDFNDTDLIEYDNTLGIQGRQKGVSVSSRSGIEIAVNGVTIINDKEFYNLTGLQPQPSSSGFRGRLNILNPDLADAFIKGGNKSCSMVNKSFSENEDTLAIRSLIKEQYYKVIRRYHTEESKRKTYYSISYIDTWCKENDIKCRFKFLEEDKNYEAFVYDKVDDIIKVNINSSLMKCYNTDYCRSIFIIAFIHAYSGMNGEEICKKFRIFRNTCENINIIK